MTPVLEVTAAAPAAATGGAAVIGSSARIGLVTRTTACALVSPLSWLMHCSDSGASATVTSDTTRSS